ncbi:MAG: hypothetical protein JKY23_06825 [Nitrospinaceae bacterium]|nr:hypothetical protein [Nitrospinaceae bacterium]
MRNAMMQKIVDQNTFNYVVAHLAKQNDRAVAEGKGYCSCQYLAPDGKSCAMGCLLDHSKVEGIKRMEGGGVTHVTDILYQHFRAGFRAVMQPQFRDVNVSLMRDLQGVHDGSMEEDARHMDKRGHFGDITKNMLRVFAHKYKLIAPAVIKPVWPFET